MYIFLDESGDLGFDLSKQGSSKYFTICLLSCENLSTMRAIKNAVRKTLKNKVNRKRKIPTDEIKSTSVTDTVKEYFIKNCPETGWAIYAITINKKNVKSDLQTKEGKKKLYNWMTKEVLSFIDIPKNIERISISVDKCKEKKDRNEFDHYIQAHLINRVCLETFIEIDHKDSKEDYCLQAVDLFCSGIRHEAEKSNSEWYQLFKKYIQEENIYFDE